MGRKTVTISRTSLSNARPCDVRRLAKYVGIVGWDTMPIKMLIKEMSRK